MTTVVDPMRPQMMGQPLSPILGGGNPINSQILQQWAQANPQQAPGAADPQRTRLAQLMAAFRSGRGMGAGAMPGGPGDAMGRTGGINPPNASPGMLGFMHNTVGRIPGFIGGIGRGLANMGGYDGGRSGAVDPRSGQVRGGGTGHVGGGLTAGGPR